MGVNFFVHLHGTPCKFGFFFLPSSDDLKSIIWTQENWLWLCCFCSLVGA